MNGRPLVSAAAAIVGGPSLRNRLLSWSLLCCCEHGRLGPRLQGSQTKVRNGSDFALPDFQKCNKRHRRPVTIRSTKQLSTLLISYRRFFVFLSCCS
jgi:hypothetical protein